MPRFATSRDPLPYLDGYDVPDREDLARFVWVNGWFDRSGNSNVYDSVEDRDRDVATAEGDEVDEIRAVPTMNEPGLL